MIARIPCHRYYKTTQLIPTYIHALVVTDACMGELLRLPHTIDLHLDADGVAGLQDG